jgi:hypothetical protein
MSADLDINIDKDHTVNEPATEEDDETIEVILGVHIVAKKPKVKHYENSVGILKHVFHSHYSLYKSAGCASSNLGQILR